MITPLSYIIAKTILVIPVIVVFALMALVVPAFLIQNVSFESFGYVILLWAVIIYYFECAAEFFAVAFDDPIIVSERDAREACLPSLHFADIATPFSSTAGNAKLYASLVRVLPLWRSSYPSQGYVLAL